jgi:hypothetical protein
MRSLTGEHDGFDVVTDHGLGVLLLDTLEDCIRRANHQTGTNTQGVRSSETGEKKSGGVAREGLSTYCAGGGR